MENRSFQHLNPIWRDKANFIIGASVPPLKNNPKEKVWEQLWARKLDNDQYEICCIPIFAYGMALGDVVEIDQGFMITNISQKSGHITIRVWLTEQIHKEEIEGLTEKILGLGCLMEWYSEHLLGIDSDSHITTQSLIKTLEIYQREGLIDFEYGNPQNSYLQGSRLNHTIGKATRTFAGQIKVYFRCSRSGPVRAVRRPK